MSAQWCFIAPYSFDNRSFIVYNSLGWTHPPFFKKKVSVIPYFSRWVLLCTCLVLESVPMVLIGSGLIYKSLLERGLIFIPWTSSVPLTVPSQRGGSCRVPHNAQFPCLLLFLSEVAGNYSLSITPFVQVFFISLNRALQLSLSFVRLKLDDNAGISRCVLLLQIAFSPDFILKLCGSSISKSYWFLWTYFISSILSKSFSGYIIF